MQQSHTKDLLIKLGADGFIAYSTEEDGFVNQHFQHSVQIQSMSQEPEIPCWPVWRSVYVLAILR